MQQDLELRSRRATRPESLSPELERLLAAMYSEAGAGDLHKELPEKTQAWLESRRLTLREALAPATQAEALQALMVIQAMPGSAPGSEAEANFLAGLTMEALRDASGWALAQSAWRFFRGEAGEGKWRPTIAQLRSEAKRLEQPYFDELSRIEKVLSARAGRPREPRKRPTEIRELLRQLEDGTVLLDARKCEPHERAAAVAQNETKLARLHEAFLAAPIVLSPLLVGSL
jgi:hypothetical protein